MNLYANDDAFIADRTAVRAGDTLMTINYNLIRNAQDVSYVIRNAETGEVYFSKDYGKQSGAFYYTNGGSWAYTSTTKGISWRFTDNEGNALPNNCLLYTSIFPEPKYPKLLRVHCMRRSFLRLRVTDSCLPVAEMRDEM